MNRIRPLATLIAGLLLAGGSALGASAAWADDEPPITGSTGSCTAFAIAGPITEPTVTSKCTDGSYEIANPDGSLERHDAAGCVTITDSEGNVRYTDATGEAVSDCGTPTPGGVDAGWCHTVADENGVESEVCAMPAECVGDDCAIAYSTMGGRDDCEVCRSVTLGAPQTVDAQMADSAVLERTAAAIDSSKSPADQSAAVDLASAGFATDGVNLTAATKSSGTSAPVAPIAAAVAGTGLIAAGFGVWRRLATRGL